MGALKTMQPTLVHSAVTKDVVFTPQPLAYDIVHRFCPTGISYLDPCKGDGAFYDLLPTPKEWCEIEQGRDFYAWTQPVDCIIGNPPYSHLLAWINHSFTLARDVVYLMPLHRVFASSQFLDALHEWGGIAEIRRYGTGADWGFPFGHALAAVHYHRGYKGATRWTRYGDALSVRNLDQCPTCGKPFHFREKRPNGYSWCEDGHQWDWRGCSVTPSTPVSWWTNKPLKAKRAGR